MIYITSKYLLPFSRWSFHLLMVFFAGKKLFSLIRFHLFLFIVVSLAWGDRSKKLLLRLPKRILSILSSKSFTSLGLKCKFLIHFELIFVVREYVLISLFLSLLTFFFFPFFAYSCPVFHDCSHEIKRHLLLGEKKKKKKLC